MGQLYRRFIRLIVLMSLFTCGLYLRQFVELFTHASGKEMLVLSSPHEIQSALASNPATVVNTATLIQSSNAKAIRRHPRRRHRRQQTLPLPQDPHNVSGIDVQRQQYEAHISTNAPPMIVPQFKSISTAQNWKSPASDNTHGDSLEYTEKIPTMTETQRRRLERLEESCRRRNVSRREPDWSMLDGDNMFFNDELRFVWCLVPKVACTTWTRVLLVGSGAEQFRGRQPNNLPQSTANNERLDGNILVSLAEYSPREVDYRLKNYFKFMFVRHPYEQLVSAYRDRPHSNHKLVKNNIGKYIVQKSE